MDAFPENFRIRLLDTKTGNPIKDVLVEITVFARHKNNYYMITLPSADDGTILVTKELIRGEIEQTRNFYIMDYSSTLEDCKPKIEVKVISADEIRRAINGYREYKDVWIFRPMYLEDLKNASNSRYQPISQLVEFNNQNEMDVVLNLSER